MIQDEYASAVPAATAAGGTTLGNVLELVMGLNAQLARQACRQCRILIDGKRYDDLSQPVELSIGSEIDIEGYGRVNVIKAHFRTLEFYANCK